MKNKGSKALTYTAAAGILLIVLVYVFCYQKLKTEAENIEASNRVLDARVKELKQYYDNREQYLLEIADMQVRIDDILAEYPAYSCEEDVIMLAVGIQMSTPIVYSGINIADHNAFQTIPAETVTAAGLEAYSGEIQFVEQEASYMNEVSYASLKQVVKTILENNNRIGIKSIMYDKNEETGDLTGSFDLRFYSVSGTAKTYEAPNIMEYLSGTENIFGKPKSDQTQGDAAENNGNSAENGMIEDEEGAV